MAWHQTMTISRQFVTILFCIFVVPTINVQTKRVTPAEAKDHVGERATVCGKVASANYARLALLEIRRLGLVKNGRFYNGDARPPAIARVRMPEQTGSQSHVSSEGCSQN
jgi:hypothetical protein